MILDSDCKETFKLILALQSSIIESDLPIKIQRICKKEVYYNKLDLFPGMRVSSLYYSIRHHHFIRNDHRVIVILNTKLTRILSSLTPPPEFTLEYFPTMLLQHRTNYELNPETLFEEIFPDYKNLLPYE